MPSRLRYVMRGVSGRHETGAESQIRWSTRQLSISPIHLSFEGHELVFQTDRQPPGRMWNWWNEWNEAMFSWLNPGPKAIEYRDGVAGHQFLRTGSGARPRRPVGDMGEHAPDRASAGT
jgi:hypothetical protein